MNINEYIKRKSGKAHAPQMTPEEAGAKYAGMDEAELMSELFKAAEQGRASGELNNDVIDSFYTRLLPLLTPEQSERMRELINQLKR